MFFPRMRRHAKWMFVLLALIFGLGFVLFGVGAGGVGVGELGRGDGGGSGGPSASDARERLEKNPKDAEALRDLATALQVEAEPVEAVQPLEQYVALRPNDTDALRELAVLYLARARERQQDAQIAQLRAQLVTGGGLFSQSLQLDENQSLGEDPISKAVNEEATRLATAAFTDAQAAYTNAIETYEKLVKASPDDPTVQLELATTAEQSGDYARAVTAYKRYVALAPDDPNVALVREQIKRLEEAQQAQQGATG